MASVSNVIIYLHLLVITMRHLHDIQLFFNDIRRLPIIEPMAKKFIFVEMQNTLLP